MNIEQFFDAYIECALWSSTGCDEDGNNCFPLDDEYGPDDIAPDALASMREDCADFIESNAADLALYDKARGNEEWSSSALAGHDFWLTRNGHGAGFWDRGLGALGDRLSAAAKVYGSCDLYVGDDGKVYAS